jgi:type II pantothenate kinase
MIKVSGPSQYQRIGGTSLGGGTLWGLLSLLTGARTFDDMLAMADSGDNSSVDLLVGDIYGEGMGYEKIGLSERTIASSFGKVLKRKREAERDAEDGSNYGEKGESSGSPTGEGNGSKLIGDGRMFAAADISRSLLYAIR